MPVRMPAILATLALSLPALAWEPQSPAAVQSRIDELQKAWSGKSAEEIAQDKVTRARQARPQWGSRRAWKMELGPITYYFAVGKAGLPAAASAPPPTARVTAGRPLGWRHGDSWGALYT